MAIAKVTGQDLVGKKFGKLFVIAALEGKRGCRKILVRCDCGLEKAMRRYPIQAGKVTGCGCARRKARGVEVGNRFGRLEVLAVHDPDAEGRRTAEVRCDCGAIKIVGCGGLAEGTILSCGCFRIERVRAAHTRHGEGAVGKRSAEYSAWTSMVNRCEYVSNPEYPRYGGRGIVVCRRWRESFVAFLQDMGRRPSGDHSLDRIDNDGDYGPENCRWATKNEQMRNRSDNVWVEAFGCRKIVKDWEDECGVSASTILARIGKGWTPEQAVSTPRWHRPL